MQQFLCISITFLLDRFHGRTLGDRAPEWPPSPLRLFQALVATAHRGRGEAALPHAEETALQWLESLCEHFPPTIVAKSSSQATPYVIAVPNNDLDAWARPLAAGRAPKKQPNELRTLKTVRPTAILDNPIEQAEANSTVQFVWPIRGSEVAEDTEPFVSIRRLARRIISVGWGLDLVAADARLLREREANAMRGTRWRPGTPISDSPSDRPVPMKGTLNALRVRHNRWLGRVNSKSKQYDDVPPYVEFDDAVAPRVLRAYEPGSVSTARPFAAFVLRPIDKDAGYVSFPAERAVCVAAMVRHAACDAAMADLENDSVGNPLPDAWRTNEWSLRFVAGHGPEGAPKRRTKHDSHPRFSYLPLPSINHEHADGAIRRAILAEPFGGDGRSARWAAQRLNGAVLMDEARGPIARLEFVEPDDPEFRRVFRLYAAHKNSERNTVWTSVTPVILPRHPKSKLKERDNLLRCGLAQDESDAKALALDHDREKILVDCLRDAGIDFAAVESLESRPPAWPTLGGASTSLLHSAYRRPAYLRALPACHVRIRFRAPIAGPISLGAGRHCGLGALAGCEC